MSSDTSQRLAKNEVDFSGELGRDRSRAVGEALHATRSRVESLDVLDLPDLLVLEGDGRLSSRPALRNPRHVARRLVDDLREVAHRLQDRFGGHESSFEFEGGDKPRRMISEGALRVADEAKDSPADAKPVDKEGEVALADKLLHIDVKVVAVFLEIFFANGDTKETLGLVATKCSI